MVSEPTPAQIGRAIGLQRVAAYALDMAAELRPDTQGISADDKAFLIAQRQTLESVAERLRKSPGFTA